MYISFFILDNILSSFKVLFWRKMAQNSPLILSARRLLELSAGNVTNTVDNNILLALKSQELKCILPILFSIIFSISMPLNSLSLWFLYQYSRPWTPTIVFCINLCITDLVYSTILPFQIVYHLMENHWPFGDIFCRFITVLFYGNMYCSILTMMSISIERYLGIVHPLRYKAMRSIQTSVLTCIIIWALVLLTLLPLMKNKLTFTVHQMSIITCFDILPKDMFKTTEAFIIYFGGKTAFFFLLPFLIMMFCYISIIFTLLHSSSTQLQETKRQTVYLIIVLLLLLSVCYIPHMIISTIHYVFTLHGKSLYVWYKLSLAVTSFNCCIDPFIYYFGSKEFRRKIQKKLCRCVGVGFSDNTPIFSEHDMQITRKQKSPKK